MQRHENKMHHPKSYSSWLKKINSSHDSSREEYGTGKGKSFNMEIYFCRVLTIKSYIIFSLLRWSFPSTGYAV